MITRISRRIGRPARSGPLAIVVSAAATSGVLATVVIAAGPVPRCHTVDLTGRLKPGSPGAGQRYATLLLRNRSGHSCRVFGYVGAQLVGATGRPLPTRVMGDHSRTPRRVILAPGRRAQTLLHWGVIPGPGEPQERQCEPTPRKIRITPPDETTQLVLGWPFGAVCEHGSFEVRPLVHA